MKAPAIFFHPRRPDVRHSIWRIADILGLSINQMSEGGLIGFLGDGGTFCTELIDPEGKKILNGGCIDISKAHVDTCFRQVFGYSLEIDPFTFCGQGVKKSNLNYKHDGAIISFPITEKEDGVVYNKLINNVQDGSVEDLRVPIVGKSIPFVFLRYRSISKRFSDEDDRVTIAETLDCLSEKEVGLILDFCQKMNFDFGELDILKNRDENGRLYIVDANKTPASPPRKLSFIKGHKSMRRLAASFRHEFLSHLEFRNNWFKLCVKRVPRWTGALLLATSRILKKYRETK